MEPSTLMDLVRRSADYLTQRGIRNGRREAEWIFCHFLAMERLDLFTRFDMLLDNDEVDRLRTAIQRRGRREPLAYILGNQPFCGLDLQVSPAVLVPRPETEELVALALADGDAMAAAPTVLDVGTGSGAIALAIASARPIWAVSAVDASADALHIARANAQRLNLRVHFEYSDLVLQAPGPWDLICANLPYVGEDERERCDPEISHEPAMALFSGGDGLHAIRRLIDALPAALTPAGVCWLEHGDRQGAAIADLCQAKGLSSRLKRDQQDRERFTRVWAS